MKTTAKNKSPKKQRYPLDPFDFSPSPPHHENQSDWRLVPDPWPISPPSSAWRRCRSAAGSTPLGDLLKVFVGFGRFVQLEELNTFTTHSTKMAMVVFEWFSVLEGLPGGFEKERSLL